MAETPQPQVTESAKHLVTENPAVSRKLKIDALDRNIQNENTRYHAFAGAGIFLGLALPTLADSLINGFYRPGYFNTPMGLAVIAGTTLMLATPSKAVESFYSERQIKKIETRHSIQNSDPFYNAERIVYKGVGLETNGFRLNKGDNLYYVNLPVPRSIGQNIPTAPLNISPEQLGLLSQYYSLILRDLRDKTAQRDYQGVVLDFGYLLNPENPNLKKYGNAASVTNTQLFEGKNIKQTDQTSTTLLLPREVLETVPLSPDDIFNKAVDALEADIGDKISGVDLVARLRNLGKIPKDARIEEAIALRHRLDNLFNLQAETRFNSLPDVSIERTPLGPVRKKSQIHPTLKVTQNSKGVFLEEISYSRGDRQFLVKLDVPIEEALKPGSKDRTLLLTYAVSEMLSTPEKIMEATEEEALDPIAIYDKLRKTGISLAAPRELYVAPKSHKYLKGVRDIALVGAIGIGTLNVAQAIPALQEIPHILNIDLPFGLSGDSQSSEEAGDITLNHLEDKEEAGIGNYPPSHLDWKVETNGLSPDGYYISSTSYDFQDGGWIIDNNPESAQKLDSNALRLDYTWAGTENPGRQLLLAGSVDLDHQKKAKLRLPIREGTTIQGLRIITLDGTTVSPNFYNVYKFKDGTFVLDISADPDLPNSSVAVSYTLVESELGPHASRRLEAIDTTKLSPEAYRLLQESGNNLEILRMKVSLDKPYSIDPPNKDVLDGVDGSDEAEINAIQQLLGSSCDTSNTEFALLSSSLSTSEFVNTAGGYLGISSGGFLNRNMSHRFNVDNEGDIFDATAGNGTLGDEKTKKYFASLGQTPQDAAAEWEREVEQEREEQIALVIQEKQKQELLNNIQTLLLLGGLTGSLIVAPKGIDAIRRRFSKERVDKIRDQAKTFRYLHRLSAPDLEEAYRFFNWMSFGEGKQFPRYSDVDIESSSREEMARRIKKGVLEKNLRLYLRHPEKFEHEAGIGKSRKLRRIAKYLLN